MANRTLRRARSKADGPAVHSDGDRESGSVAGIDASDAIPSGTESDVDGSSQLDSTKVDGTARIGVVEVDPGDIDKFIAEGGHRIDTDKPDTGEPRQRRTRSPNGTRRSGRSKEAPQDISPLLNMVHTWAPIMLGIPELAVSPAEQKQLADAYAEFQKHHAVPAVTEKRISEANLVIAICMIYGTRVMAVAKRKSNERKTAAQNNVTPITQQRTQVM